MVQALTKCARARCSSPTLLLIVLQPCTHYAGQTANNASSLDTLQCTGELRTPAPPGFRTGTNKQIISFRSSSLQHKQLFGKYLPCAKVCRQHRWRDVWWVRPVSAAHGVHVCMAMPLTLHDLPRYLFRLTLTSAHHVEIRRRCGCWRAACDPVRAPRSCARRYTYQGQGTPVS